MPTDDLRLIIVNANVLTMDPANPWAEAVVVSGQRIKTVGTNASVSSLRSPGTMVIDCQGLTILPGFNDAHCHLPGLARRLRDLDCSPQRTPSISRLQELVREWKSSRPAGSWVRGFGYDDLQLAERRHPDRHDLDIASPDCPVWLEHRSGHAAVLNSIALARADITEKTPDPSGGVIERDPDTGAPTGVLFEMQGFLRQRLGSTRSVEDFDDGMRAADELLRRYGITSAQDAGHRNGIDRWNNFQHLKADDILSCRITMFAGIEQLDELVSSGLSFGAGDEGLRLGHAKIMLTLTSGTLHPSQSELQEMIAAAHDMGFPVAIHCIEEEAIAAATAALIANRKPGLPDRIEHCAEGTSHLLEAVKKSKAAVATQPGFLYHNGGTYRRSVDARLLPHLYPAGALMRSGVATAFGSDAPVIDPDPWPAIYSAVTRCTSDGKPLADNDGERNGLTVHNALRAYTAGSAHLEETSLGKGSLAPGMLADMVLLDSDPLSIDTELLPSVKAVMTIVGGSVVWERNRGEPAARP